MPGKVRPRIRSQKPKQPNSSTTTCAPKAAPQKTEQSASKDWNDQSHRDQPHHELEDFRLEDGGEPPKAKTLKPEPERQEEVQVNPNAKRDKCFKGENTKSESLPSNPKAARERARTQLQKEYYMSTSGRNSTRFCTGWERATWCQVSTIHDMSTLGFRCRSKEISTASVNCALAKGQMSHTATPM